MDKLARELLELLQALQTGHDRMLALAAARQQAMRSFDAEKMNQLMERERQELSVAEGIEQRRQNLLVRVRGKLPRGVSPTVSTIAGHCPEPLKSQLLVAAGRVKEGVEKLQRANRINARVSQAVVASLSKVLKIMTGVAQHAGLYMRNGQKATIRGIHLLDAVA